MSESSEGFPRPPIEKASLESPILPSNPAPSEQPQTLTYKDKVVREHQAAQEYVGLSQQIREAELVGKPTGDLVKSENQAAKEYVRRSMEVRGLSQEEINEKLRPITPAEHAAAMAELYRLHNTWDQKLFNKLPKFVRSFVDYLSGK